MLSLPPRLADRYRVAAPLGRGAIAEVVRAVDESTGATVALKVLYPALRESAVVVERFRREVDLCRRIRQRHVLAIHEVLESEGYLFLVMDYHPGGDLADRIARGGPLPAPRLRALAGQLGAALAAAHQVGIVHRDVKPSNVLAGAGPDLDVRLCDFGLARSGEGAGLTTSAAVLGTPEYMAPEVIAEGHADPRSDLYSLGVVLFEAATGRLPFVADSPYQMMRMHLQDDPPRARDRAPALPADLDAAITRALAKDPLDRFASADELIAAFAEPAPDEPRPLWAVPAAPRSPPCPACGGWLVESAAVCADCGREQLRLDHDPKGVAVLVTGPGPVGDKLGARQHVALYRLLGELPTDVGPPLRQARAPRYPFYVARALTMASAERLLPRLKELGLEARIEQRRLLPPAEMRKKVKTLVGRLLAGTGAAGWMGQQMYHVIPRDWLPGLWRLLAFPALLTALGLTFAVTATRGAIRPLVAPPPRGSSDRSSPSTGDRLGALTGWLRRSSSRQDRRLLARIHERLARLAGGAEADLIPASAARAVELATALGRLDQASQANESVALDRSNAQSELRRLERGRVLIRAELLRLSSHLEALASGAARRGLHGSDRDRAAALSAIEAMATGVEAHRELEAFLRPAPVDDPGAPGARS